MKRLEVNLKVIIHSIGVVLTCVLSIITVLLPFQEVDAPIIKVSSAI
jgi:hypothetical protein